MNKPHYVIVDAASCTGDVNYRGIDREPWRQVDDLLDNGRLPSTCEQARKRSLETHLGNLSFGTLTDLRKVSLLVGQCADPKSCEVIEVALANEGPFTLGNLLYGIDLYADGYGSLLRLGAQENPSAFSDFIVRLTPYGLLPDIDTAVKYETFFRAIARSEGLEYIGDDVPVYAYWVGRAMPSIRS